MVDQLIGVLLMTYGSPESLNDVEAYLAHVRGGRTPPPELVAEFQRRYRVIGGSPLLRITREQAVALEEKLSRSVNGQWSRVKVAVGMQHAPPFIADAVAALASAPVERLVGVILSPQYSPIIMGGYHRALREACAEHLNGVPVTVAGAWHGNPLYLRALEQRTREALDRFPPPVRDRVPVLLTAHSLPKRVVDEESAYLEQLQETVRGVAELLDLTPARWRFAYQSAGHTQEEWLKPDLKDLLAELRAQGHRAVLVVPVQFLADHLEILYDLDVAARAQAEACGIRFARIESLNTMPLFIDALADVVRSADYSSQAFSARRISRT